MNDVAVPLAFGGHSLVLEQFVLDMADDDRHVGAFIELVRHRYVSTLLRPMWGVLFTIGEKDDADAD